MITIDGHTFDETLLDDGWVIDAGCRGFSFAKHFPNVLALDIENFDNVPKGVQFKHAALTCYSGEVDAYLFGDGTANFIRPVNEEPSNTEDRPCISQVVKAVTLDDLYQEIGKYIDILKLDIEGSEYEVMMKMEPIPRQITVETHEHCHEHLHAKLWPKIMKRMSEWYHIHLFHVEPRYHYLDCLFVRKDIL
jgi:FkbM family methyltransferase